MSISRDIFDLRTAGAYIPSLLLFSITPDEQVSRLLVFFGLLFAVYIHGLSRNVFGVGGPEQNPLKTKNAKKELLVALTGKGPRDKFPADTRGIAYLFVRDPALLGVRGLIFAIFFVISLAIWPITLGASFWFAFSNLSGITELQKILLFLQAVWVLQWLVWSGYAPAYLLEEEDFDQSESG